MRWSVSRSSFGYAADVTAHRGVLEDDGLYLPKPFTLEAFAAKVSEILAPESQGSPAERK